MVFVLSTERAYWCSSKNYYWRNLFMPAIIENWISSHKIQSRRREPPSKMPFNFWIIKDFRLSDWETNYQNQQFMGMRVLFAFLLKTICHLSLKQETRQVIPLSTKTKAGEEAQSTNHQDSSDTHKVITSWVPLKTKGQILICYMSTGVCNHRYQTSQGLSCDSHEI